jgi:hypothetical protein
MPAEPGLLQGLLVHHEGEVSRLDRRLSDLQRVRPSPAVATDEEVALWRERQRHLAFAAGLRSAVRPSPAAVAVSGAAALEAARLLTTRYQYESIVRVAEQLSVVRG